MSSHYAVVGPPGTGKTTYLKDQIANAAAKLGSSEVLACSLTKGAAAELRERAQSVPPDRVGTLHSFAYRSLDAPVVAETKLDEWNEANPFLRLSAAKAKTRPDKDQPEGMPSDETPGDVMHTQMELYRHRMVPEQAWRSNVQGFARKWREWLADTGYLDFTGMIEQALEYVPCAPGRPLAMFVDEAQDMSRLEMSLVRSWGMEVNTLITVGDPAQALFTFRGAEPQAFFDVGDASHRRVLQQSYRVPARAHAKAVKWASGLLKGIEYRPTDVLGEIGVTAENMRYAEGVARALEDDLKSHSGTVMIQAQAGYMLRPLIAVLRQNGVPFHNPNRLHDGSWNPLARRAKSTSTVDRLLAWLKEDQTFADVAKWLPMIKATGVLVKGAKERTLTDDSQVPGLFASDEAMTGALSGDPRWLMANATAEFSKRLAYPLAVLKRYGEGGLSETPRLQIGTIHSMKGAESDSVWVAPDLSPGAWKQYLTESQDDARRLFYVALTRARHKLTILRPSGGRHVCLD